jgi:hypothetical protein
MYGSHACVMQVAQQSDKIDELKREIVCKGKEINESKEDMVSDWK